VVSELTFGGFNSHAFYAMAVAKDGGLVLAGTVYNAPTESTDGWLVRLSPGGQTQWNEAFGGTKTQNDVGRAVAVLGDGGLVLASGGKAKLFHATELASAQVDASALWLLPGGDGHDVRLLVSDPAGAPKLNIVLSAPFVQAPLSVIRPKAGGYLACGYRKGTPGNSANFDAQTWRFDDAGNGKCSHISLPDGSECAPGKVCAKGKCG